MNSQAEPVGKERTCVCGSMRFERVSVERQYKEPYVTAFIACRECGVMYYAPDRPARWLTNVAARQPEAPPSVPDLDPTAKEFLERHGMLDDPKRKPPRT